MDLKKIEIKTDKDDYKNVIVTYSIYGGTAEVKLQSGFRDTRIKEALIIDINDAVSKYFRSIETKGLYRQLHLFGEEEEHSFLEIGIKKFDISSKDLKDLNDCLKEEGSDVGISEEV